MADHCFAECRYAECRYAECRYAEWECVECHYAACHYAKCRGAESGWHSGNSSIRQIVLTPHKTRFTIVSKSVIILISQWFWNLIKKRKLLTVLVAKMNFLIEAGVLESESW